jgi:hypothetical protein
MVLCFTIFFRVFIFRNLPQGDPGSHWPQAPALSGWVFDKYITFPESDNRGQRGIGHLRFLRFPCARLGGEVEISDILDYFQAAQNGNQTWRNAN